MIHFTTEQVYHFKTFSFKKNIALNWGSFLTLVSKLLVCVWMFKFIYCKLIVLNLKRNITKTLYIYIYHKYSSFYSLYPWLYFHSYHITLLSLTFTSDNPLSFLSKKLRQDLFLNLISVSTEGFNSAGSYPYGY